MLSYKSSPPPFPLGFIRSEQIPIRREHEADPIRAIVLFDRDPTFGTDRTTSGLMEFGTGRQLSFTVSTQSVRFQTVQGFGTCGRIEFEIPFNAPPSEPAHIHVDDG